MTDIKKKAEEWVEINKTDYEGYGDPDCEDYEPQDLERGMKAAYLAGAKERDRNSCPISERVEVTKDGCHEWQGGKMKSKWSKTEFKSYGTLHINRRVILAHRLMWNLMKGRIPQGLGVLHTCDNPLCINIEHLFLGTAEDNTADALRKGRKRVGGCQKKSKYNGVTKVSGNGGKWQANIKKGRKRYYLGSFNTELEAAHAYDAKAQEFYGDGLHLNFPDQASEEALEE